MANSGFIRTPSTFLRKKMDKLRRSFRESFRKHRGGSRGSDLTKPQLWQQDEAAVRAGTCTFPVKYLGCVEVFDSRGMHVCEEALKVLRNTRRHPVKGILYVSGDGLRVVDAENKGLIVDQTIEKVSFCAPDRNHEHGFAYICRDGTTRRWMCHGFHAAKESGERLSHAVGCAFAVCLEKKQKRDREVSTASNQQIIHDILTTSPNKSGPNSVQQSPSSSASASASTSTSNFQRGGFRYASLQERRQDPQNVIVSEPPPLKPVVNPHALQRPRAALEPFDRNRAGSLRESSGEPQFKRNYSLRINELQANRTRQRNSQLNGLSWTAPNPIPEVSPSCEAEDSNLSGEFAQRLEFNNSGPQHVPFDVSATSARSNRSKAEEWLEMATQQVRNPTPPSVEMSPMHALSNQNSTNRMNGESSSKNFGAGGGNATHDLFGQPIFSNFSPEILGRSNSVTEQNGLSIKKTLPIQHSIEIDSFDSRWEQLNQTTNSTNPFSTESSAVNI